MNKETLGILIKLLTLDEDNKDNSKGSFLKEGEIYFIRTVTMIYGGRIKKINGDEVILEAGAYWIAHTGRLHESLVSCEFEEIEKLPRDHCLYRQSFIAAELLPKMPVEKN